MLERMKFHEDALVKAKEYIETGAHSNWPGFRALFSRKTKDGREIPPHKDWVRNVFIPRHEKAICKAEKNLERLEKKR